MSVNVEWMTASETRVSLEPYGWVAPDGQKVTEDGVIVLSGNEVVAIEGSMVDMQILAAKLLQTVQPHRHSELERLVRRAKAAATGPSATVHVERLQEALDVALTMLVREDLR